VSVDGGTTAQYSYDNQNRRFKKVSVGATTHYVWEGSQVFAEHNGSTGSVIADHIYSGTRMIAKVEGGATRYFLSDRLSVRLMLDASGNVVGRQAHLPFGEDFAESGTQQKQHFTSYERDSESGLDYAINRYYKPVAATFGGADPILDIGFKSKNEKTIGCAGKKAIKDYLGNPQSLNLYSYSLNDPVNKVDPLGLKSCWWELTKCVTALIGYYGSFTALIGSCGTGNIPACVFFLVVHAATGPAAAQQCGDALKTCGWVKEPPPEYGPPHGRSGGGSSQCFGWTCGTEWLSSGWDAIRLHYIS
jgi:RHS repeat-associated protein